MKAVLEYLQQELYEGWDVKEEIAEVEKAIAELDELQEELRIANEAYALLLKQYHELKDKE